MKKKTFLFIIFFLSVTFILTGQSDISGFTPVNQETGYVNSNRGNPNFTIPITNISGGTLNIPVYLSYSSDGIKTSELPSEIGLGWKLNARGKIVQIVRGLNDLRNDYAQVLTEDLSVSQKQQILSGYLDSERDYFVLDLPGYSNSFFYEKTENIEMPDGGVKTVDFFKTFTESGLIIENTWTGTNDYPFYKYGFKITTPDGTKYFFERIQTFLQYEGNTGRSKKYIWYLTKAEDIYNNEVFLFYNGFTVPGKTQNDINFLYTGKSIGSNNVEIENYKEEVYLKRISSRSGTVIFNIKDITEEYSNYISPYGNGTVDIEEIPDNSINNTDKILSEVQIFDYNNELIKKYKFEYEFASDTNFRFFLKSVYEQSPQGNKIPPYKFYYYDLENLSKINYKGFDYWGYQNREGDVSFTGYSYPERVPDTSMLKRGMLERIHFPEGYNLNFEYENNRYAIIDSTDWYNEDWVSIILHDIEPDTVFTDVNLSDMPGPGVRVKKITKSNDSVKYIKEFGYTLYDGISSGHLTYYPILKFNYLFEGRYRIFRSIYPIGLDEGKVSYEKITSFEGGKIPYTISNNDKGKNGKIENYYEVTAPQIISSSEDFPYDIIYYNEEISDYLRKTITYNANNDILSVKENTYKKTLIPDCVSENLKIILKSSYPSFDFYEATYNIHGYRIKQTKQTETIYKTGDTSRTEQTFFYSRDNKEYLDITKSQEKISYNDNFFDDEIIYSEYYYPVDYSEDNTVFDFMVKKNMLSVITKEELFTKTFSKSIGIKSSQLSGKKNTFRFKITSFNDTLVVPDKYQIWENGEYKTVKWFDKYTDRGKLKEWHDIDSIHYCYLYGYNGELITAEITNAAYEQIDNILTENDYYKLNNPSSDEEVRSIIDKIRNALPEAFVSSYTYKPLIGKTSETDPNGISVYYEYDEFGRLKHIKDQDGIVVKKFDYNFGINNN